MLMLIDKQSLWLPTLGAHKLSNQSSEHTSRKQLTVPTHTWMRMILKMGMTLPCLLTKAGDKWVGSFQALNGRPSSDRTTCVTASPLTHLMHPSSTFDTWNIVFTLGSRAPPSQKTTCPIHQSSLNCCATCCAAWTITQSPGLTLRNVGGLVPASGLIAVERWSTLANTPELLSRF